MSVKRLQDKDLEVVSMFKMKIWDRDFDLKVIYDCYAGEEILEEQKEALRKFSSDKKTIELSKEYVEKYCMNQNKEEIGSDRIDNIFKYVIPESIFVKRDGCVAILCKYRYDEEHGIAVVFNNGQFKEVGSQDIIF